MPKCKDSPEEKTSKKERNEKPREFLTLLDVEDISDPKLMFKETVGVVLENGLEAELDDELGYSRYDYRSNDTENGPADDVIGVKFIHSRRFSLRTGCRSSRNPGSRQGC